LNGSKEDWLTFQRKIADALLAQGRRDEALALLEKVLKQYPKDPLALAQRASLWLDMGNPSGLANTVRELESTVSVLPPNAVLRYQLGRAYFAKGDLEQARTQFQAAVDIQADYLDPRRALIEINLKKLEWALALRLADETLAHLKEARRDDPLTRLFRAEALQGLGKVDDARNDLQAFLKQYPNSGEAMRRLGEVEIASGDSLAALGQSKSSADRYAAALRSFEECAKLSKGDFRCLANESAVYALRLRQFDKAVDLVSGELKKSPDSRELRLALANTFAMSAQNFTELKKYDAAMGRFKEAAAVYTALLAKEPENADLHNRLAEACRFMGEVGEATGRPDVAKEQFNLAIEHWRRVQQLQPKNPYAAVWLAIMLERTGQAKEAKRHYEEALQIDPENPVALNNLAFQMADGGSNLDMALTYAQRAVQSAQAVAIKLKAKSTATPDEVSDTLAWIYMKKKLTAEALAIYDKLVVNQPANPSFRYHRGLALLQKGDKLQAKKEFQTALASKPSPEERAKINADLAKVD
jgi:tetratricopeptide (TPR) repeat protein